MNKAKYYGHLFGKFCTYFGVILMMCMIPFIANENSESLIHIINWNAFIAVVIGFGLYLYGEWRCNYG